MKKIILFSNCLMINLFAIAQSPVFNWAKQLGGKQHFDFGYSITTDASGNVYTTGVFQDTADFDPGPGTFNLITSTPGIFVSKLDASGNFAWAKKLGSGTDGRGYAIAADALGNVITTGFFGGTGDFDPDVSGTFNLTATGYLDIFISKLDASGNFVWAKKLGGNQFDNGYSIALDASGNVYTAGTFEFSGDFDPGPGVYNLISNAGTDVFISKLDASGNFVWAKDIGGTSEDYGYSIALDPSGNIFATGYFAETADFDPGAGTYNLTADSLYDNFVFKLNSSGNFVWAKRMGGTGYDNAYSVTSDAAGNVFVTGNYQETADFNADGGGFFLLANGFKDMFVEKLDAAGNFLWAKGIGGTPGSANGRCIKTDASGNVYVTGSFAGTADFDPGINVFNLTATGSYDIFISKFDPFGNFIWAARMGSFMDDEGYSIALDAMGNVYTTGYFSGTTDFDPGTGTYNLTAPGGTNVPDIFVHKMSPCTPPSATITPAGPTTFCSGGSVVLNAPAGVNKAYQWKKGTNLISGATLSSYTATTGGNYRVIVTNTVTGCSKTTGSATVVTVNALPSATITPQGPTTFCAGGSVVLQANTGTGLTYKWKKGSNFISGATLSNYTATTGGNYRVQVTNSNGCSKVSGLVAVSVPCKEGESVKAGEGESEFEMEVFPNPNSGEFTIKFSNKPISSIQIELTDELGKVVKKFETDDETVIIKESNLAKGIYCLNARNADKIIIKKISIVQ